jgi:cell division septation protein DedD
MRELKPKLIITDSGRRRKGPGGFWSLLTLLIVFLVGVYAGTKLDDLGLIGGGLKETGNEITSGQKPVTYDQKSAESLVRSYKIADKQKSEADGGAGLMTAENQITHENISPAPVLSVSENKTNTGITSIDPGRMTGVSSETENTVTAEPGIKPDDTANSTTNKTEQPARGKYTLQVAAFADKADAEKAVNEYRSKGFNAYIVRIQNSKGEKWNLVKIGEYGSMDEAWRQSALFKRTEGKDAYVEVLGKKTVFNESWDKNEKKGN